MLRLIAERDCTHDCTGRRIPRGAALVSTMSLDRQSDILARSGASLANVHRKHLSSRVCNHAEDRANARITNAVDDAAEVKFTADRVPDDWQHPSIIASPGSSDFQPACSVAPIKPMSQMRQ